MRCFLIAVLAGLASGCGVPSFLITPVSHAGGLREQVVRRGKGLSPDKVVLIEVEGMLLNAQSGGFMQPSENAVSRFVEQMDKAAQDPRVKAVVLRVNSPGGTVAASDILYQRVLQFRHATGKPVIAAPQDVAASGAYYVSCAADAIVAHPASIVGSIGVIYQTFDASGTMGKIGLKSEAIKSGQHKDMGSIFRPLDDSDRKLMQAMVEEYYGRFRTVVTASRPIADEQKLAMATDGRVFTGTEAAKLGLVDATGMLDDAIDLAEQMAGARDARVVLYKRPYGYSGSIYASTEMPAAAEYRGMELKLPAAGPLLPTGFYYLWRPGM